MNGRAVGLDHVGIVGPDLDSLAEIFATIGFQVMPRATHDGGRTGNRCIMLHGSYLELVATVDGGTSATLARFLARHAGIHILALAIDAEAPVLARLQRAGLQGLHASGTERALDDSRPDGPHVAFSLIAPPDLPEGRLLLIRHLTPDTLWQPTALRHDNAAHDLTEITILSAAPAATAARLSTLAGWPVIPDPAGGYDLDLPRGRVRILPPEARPDATSLVLPRIAGLTLRTSDGNASLSQRLKDRHIPHRINDRIVELEAAGVMLRFVPYDL
ncbi:MAG: VOC family protein [Acetobacteraceae bacterium]